jgi:hypothetical protein
MSGFKLETFEKIISKEMREIMTKRREEKLEQIKNDLDNDVEYKKKPKKQQGEEIDSKELKKTLKYYHDHVFKTVQGNYFIQQTEDPKKLTSMSCKAFNDVYGQTIKEFHPNLLKKDVVRYEVDIYDRNFIIDKENKKINLATPFNFEFTEEPLIEEEKDLLNFLLDEFVFKVICASNQSVYDFVLDMMGCYAHRKQTEIILILVGEGGTGKSKFIELLQALFGQACKMMTDQVMGGQDMFNSSMIGTTIGYIEETNGKGESNYTDIQRTLKRLTTSKYITCRKMQTDSFDVLNIINFVIVTNFIKDIKHDRRNLPVEPSTHRINDKDFYGKITGILKNERVMSGLFNMLYNRDYKVWARKLPATDILNDFTEQSSMKLVYEFFIDEMIHKSVSEKMTLNDMFPLYEKFLHAKGKDFKASETIFKHEARQFLIKLPIKTLNKIWFDTSKATIKESLLKRHITEEMINSRLAKDFDIKFDKNDPMNYDPDEQIQENANLRKLITEQAQIIEDQKRMIEKLMLQSETKEYSEKKEKKKAKQSKGEIEWESLKSII